MGVRISTGGGGRRIVCPACGNPVGRVSQEVSDEELARIVWETLEDHSRVCLPSRRMSLRFRRRRR